MNINIIWNHHLENVTNNLCHNLVQGGFTFLCISVANLGKNLGPLLEA